MRPALLLALFLAIIHAASCDYWSDRKDLIQADQKHSIDANIVLNEKEQMVNDKLMRTKYAEYNKGFKKPQLFLPSRHFFETSAAINQSKVFKFITWLPKGGSLHSHDGALASAEYLYTLTFRDNLYYCIVENGRLSFQFAAATPTDPPCEWRLVSETRHKNATFNDYIQQQISIVVPNPAEAYDDIDSVWARFLSTFDTVFGLISYKPIFEDYFYQALKELHDDNVMYMEFRGILPPVYDLAGKIYTPAETVQLYIDTLARFKADYPDFHDAKFIFAPLRFATNATFDGYVKLMRELNLKFPKFVIGFDLVGQEDKGGPLKGFIPQLLDLAARNVSFFFHAGETDWYGSTDFNLYDAILLNSTRIGHGYGIMKHPELVKELRRRRIAVEVCPISNQVLKLVDDLRNHPGSSLIAFGVPIVVTNDDPGFWGAKGLSFDWYMAYMAMASRDADLRFLKRLAINSIVFSGLEREEKRAALRAWRMQWTKFLDRVISEF